MAFPQQARILWFGTAASIPAGWSRDTAFDDKFVQGALADILGTGGAATHQHDLDHTHIGDVHTHDFSSNTPLITGTKVRRTGPELITFAAHGHVTETSEGTAIEYGTDSQTVDAGSLDPENITAIVLAPDAPGIGIPQTAAIWSDTSVMPVDFLFADGSGLTTDLRNRFVKGAAPAGNGGGVGGSASHVHTVPSSGAHSHTEVNHGHAPKFSGTVAFTFNATAFNQVVDFMSGSHHRVEIDSAAAGAVSSSDMALSSASVEPAHVELGCYQQVNAMEQQTPHGGIVIFVGADAEIPLGWLKCDGSQGTPDLDAMWIKNANTEGAIGTSGGSATHTHDADTSHTHTHPGTHDHGSSVTVENFSFPGNGTLLSKAPEVPDKDHTHTWTVTGTTPTMGAETPTTDAVSGYPPFVKAFFVKRVKSPSVLDEDFCIVDSDTVDAVVGLSSSEQVCLAMADDRPVEIAAEANANVCVVDEDVQE